MLTPTVSADFVTTAGTDLANVMYPRYGAVGPHFYAYGPCARGVTKLKLEVFPPASTTPSFSKSDIVPSPGFPYWTCEVTVVPPPTAVTVYTLTLTPTTSAGDQTPISVDVTIDPNLATFSFTPTAAPAALAKAQREPAMALTAPAEAATSYVRIPYTYTDPTDAGAPLYEVVASLRQFFKSDGSVGVEPFDPCYTTGPSKARNLWIPYRGPGVYYARFVRIEGVGNIHAGPPVPVFVT